MLEERSALILHVSKHVLLLIDGYLWASNQIAAAQFSSVALFPNSEDVKIKG